MNYPGSLVRIASFTTARARTKLVSTMHLIGEKYIIYCDTDSLVFPYSRMSILEHAGIIGEKLG
jgi:hypothetical protein